MEYVRLTTIAATMNVNDSWLRGLVYQKVMDDERENPMKGSPYIMHVKQVVQALIAYRLRRARVGYDTIRIVVDAFEIDKLKTHKVNIANGVDLVLNKSLFMFEARTILKEANDLEYGREEEAA